MADIDPTKPGDNDVVSQYPPNERGSRSALETIIFAEHGEDQGRHEFGVGNDAARDAITNWFVGSFWLNTKTTPATLQRTVSIDPDVWEDIVTFEQNTVMVFFQAAAPTGWTQVTTHNNKAMRIVSGAGGGAAGTVAFTTAFASKAVTGTTDGTAITIAQMPAHDHNYNRFNEAATGGGNAHFTTKQGNAGTTTSTGSNATHNHTFTGTAINLAVQYIDMILADKD